MAITQIPPIPLRTAQYTKLSSLQHDTIHQDTAATLALVVDAVNALIIGGASLPAGISVAFAGTVLPAGFLWEDGSAVSRTTYAALFSAIGTTWGAGNGTTTFNLPKPQGRSRIYANPINGVSADTPSLTTRTLATKYGAETYAYTPAGSVPTVQGAMTGAPTTTNGAMTGTLTVTNGAMTGSLSVGGGVLSGSVSNNLAVSPITGGVLSGSVANNLAVSPVTGGTVTGATCVTVTKDGEVTESVISCSSILSFAPSGAELSGTVTNGTLAVSAISGGVLSGTVTNGTLAVSAVTVGLGTLASAVTVGLGSLASNVSVTKGTLATAVTASFTGTAATLQAMHPVSTYNSIIKY